MADITPDPFSQVYDKIWTYLEGSANLAAQVKVGNRIKFNSASPNRMKASLMRADTPQLALVPGPGTWNVMPTQPNSRCERSYLLEMVSGISQLGTMHSELEWEVARALARGVPTLGLSFVELFDFGTFDCERNPVVLVKGGHGWGGVMTLRVRLWVATTALTQD